MSYYHPYQGLPPQQYMAATTQPYYPQYYPQQQDDQNVVGQQVSDSNNFQGGQSMEHVGSNSYDQYPQYQTESQYNFVDGTGSGDVTTSGNDFYNDDGVYMSGNSMNNIGSQNNGNGDFINQFAPQQQQQQQQFNNSSVSSSQNQGIIGGGNSLQSQTSQGQQEGMYAQQQGNEVNSSVAPSRTVYLGNIPSDIQPNELLDYVRSGILESVRILPARNCAFISFVDHQSALLFHSDCILKKLNIKGHDIRIGWGKNGPILPAVMEAIQRDGATRNVYLGKLNNPLTGQVVSEEELREDLSCYGIIDCIKIIPEKGIAFVHFLSILSAIRCVANLPLKEKYSDKKCFYGKDRCAFITKTQQHNAAQYLGLAPGMEHIVTAADREFISSALVQQSAAAAQIATQAGGANNLGNRTVYLGNLHQDSSVEEICNVVRGGLLQSIRFLKERHVCFITFIDPIAAAQFFAMCQLHGLTIHNRRIKVGWGKHSGPLSNALSLAVSNGASRNIYIGNINDFNYYNPQKLRQDFAKFGDIEQINYLEEKNCAFINFVNIANAIKAIDGIKSFEDYKILKINFGKDRCGNLPRQFQSQPNNNSNNQVGNLEHGSSSQTSFSDHDFNNNGNNNGIIHEGSASIEPTTSIHQQTFVQQQQQQMSNIGDEL
ncbi:RNA-binding protein MRN1 [Spathaspora sp. JA1]|nr:RNA-binding protein MRN1 [Spathaspora sp. JA1]